jgi:antitoxin YefM
MKRLRVDQDIKPLSEFRAKLTSCIEQVQESKRPMVITQRGHSAAVMLDVAEYEQLVEELETLRDIHKATRQLDEGAGISHEQARDDLLAEFDE